jgi:hypothetical protein
MLKMSFINFQITLVPITTLNLQTCFPPFTNVMSVDVNHGLISYTDTNAKCRHLKN